VELVAEREALQRAHDRAVALLWWGVAALAALIPLMLVGGLAYAIVGRRGDKAIAAGMGGLGVCCALLGFGLLAAGVRRMVRITRALRALDHGPLPEARVVR
jgi:hypothetical protein